MILITPDPRHVGPCDLVVSEARSLPPALVDRLDLLERIAELARDTLEIPEDTESAGHLAEPLGAAGYPLREEAAA